MPTFERGLKVIADAGLDENPHRLSRLLLALHKGSGSPPFTVRGIAKHMGVPKSSITRGTNRLLAEGLAARHTDVDDKRSVLISLTAKGSKLAKALAA